MTLLAPVVIYAMALVALQQRRLNNSDTANLLLIGLVLVTLACTLACSVMIGIRRDSTAGILSFFIIAAFYGMVAFFGCTAAVVMG